MEGWFQELIVQIDYGSKEVGCGRRVVDGAVEGCPGKAAASAAGEATRAAGRTAEATRKAATRVAGEAAAGGRCGIDAGEMLGDGFSPAEIGREVSIIAAKGHQRNTNEHCGHEEHDKERAFAAEQKAFDLRRRAIHDKTSSPLTCLRRKRSRAR